MRCKALVRTPDPLSPEDVDRFWSKIDFITSPGCWLWTAAINSNGYGVLRVAGQNLYAHRVAWFVATGEWPTGLVCHRCDVPSCVRHDHHFQGSSAENTEDMMVKGRHRIRALRGEDNGNSKLTASQVRRIRELDDQGMDRTLAAEFDVSRTCIQSIRLGRGWAHV